MMGDVLLRTYKGDITPLNPTYHPSHKRLNLPFEKNHPQGSKPRSSNSLPYLPTVAASKSTKCFIAAFAVWFGKLCFLLMCFGGVAW